MQVKDKKAKTQQVKTVNDTIIEQLDESYDHPTK